jgi:hypothetical protein
MPSQSSHLFVCAILLALLLGGAGAATASQSMMRPGGVPKPMMPGPEMDSTACADLAVALEPAGDFQSMDCSRGPATHGGGTGWAMKSKIAAADGTSKFFIYHYAAGISSYFERRGPQALFEYVLDYDVAGSWSAAGIVDGYAVSRFFSDMDSARVPCFAFARHGGHVARSIGYHHRVAGLYCEINASDEPVSDARIQEMIGKIKTSFF